MTVLNSLLTKYNINKSDIGRVEVGTETLIDKSKSAKTHLLSIFGDTFGSDIEGVTSYNACYGGTAALFNSLAWLESSEWDGRYALVICGDIAVYEAGPARPTGGCGALAILLGPDAPLAIEPGVRASHVLDVYDFYKPSYSEYALVDGKLSQWAYLSSVDSCYQRYKSKYSKKYPNAAPITMDHFDYFAFHSPYNKLVQKGFARLSYIDSLTSSSEEYQSIPPEIKALPIKDTYESRDIETVFRNLSATRYNDKVMPCCKINQNIGNTYTGSVFSSLLSVICDQGEALDGKRVCMFSYGSGSVASLYSFIGRKSSSSFSIGRIQETTDMFNRLASRKQCSHDEFVGALNLRQEKFGKAPMIPDGVVDDDHLFKGTFYLTTINDKYHRAYDVY